MPADWSSLTVCTHKVLRAANRVGEADIVEGEHVIHYPPFTKILCIWWWLIFGLRRGWQCMRLTEESGRLGRQHPGLAMDAFHHTAVLAFSHQAVSVCHDINVFGNLDAKADLQVPRNGFYLSFLFLRFPKSRDNICLKTGFRWRYVSKVDTQRRGNNLFQKTEITL